MNCLSRPLKAPDWAWALMLAVLYVPLMPWMLSASAQAHPSRTQRIVVPFPLGSTSDILSRFIGQKLAGEWGHPVITDNRPGAAGNIASDFVTKSKPDGYTTYINTVGTHAIYPAIYPKLAFDPLRDFTAISNLVNLPSVLLTHPSMPVKNVKELIGLAKQRPSDLQYSSAGSGAQPHLTAGIFKTMAGDNLLPAPVLEKVRTTVSKIVPQPDMRDKLIGLGAEPALFTLMEFADLIKAELVKWAKVVKDSSVNLD